MEPFDWEGLSHLQIGKYAEYFVKMEFTRRGFEVYSPEVDEHGIDFVVRWHRGSFYDVQVKSARGYNYIFFQKDKFDLSSNLLAAVVLFHPGKPPMPFLIPSTAWKIPTPPLVDQRYEGKRSKPEWGLNLSAKNMAELEQYAFDRAVARLVGGPEGEV